MSGHSKWSSIKRKKGVADAKRGQIFTKIANEFTFAEKNSGDPYMNPALWSAIDKAKAANMPKDNIEKAIKKGTGELPGVVYEEHIYEGRAPFGIALLIRTISDNKNRTTADVRHTLSKYGGKLDEPGCVIWNFDKKGEIFVKKEMISENDLMELIIEVGAEDMKTEEEGYYITCDYKDLFIISDTLRKKNVLPDSSEITYIAQNPIKLEDDQTKRVLKLLNVIDELEDVSNIFSNLDIPDNITYEEE